MNKEKYRNRRRVGDGFLFLKIDPSLFESFIHPSAFDVIRTHVRTCVCIMLDRPHTHLCPPH